MKYIEIINKSIDFIEENLKNDINCQEIANSVGYSLYHFNRMFASLTTETPGSYLRKRRLSEASKELKNTTKKVFDISFNYWFGSQEAFTRSFKSFFDVNPLEYRNSNALFLKTFDKLYLKDFHEVISMKHRIEKKEKMTLVGLNVHVTGRDFNYIGAWGDFMKNYYSQIAHKNNDVTMALGIYPESFPEPWQYDYMPSVEVTDISDVTLNLSIKVVPESNYIVFTHAGPKEKINETYDYIYSKGLSELGYTSSASYDFEYYDSRFNESLGDKAEMEIWVPIKN